MRFQFSTLKYTDLSISAHNLIIIYWPTLIICYSTALIDEYSENYLRDETKNFESYEYLVLSNYVDRLDLNDKLQLGNCSKIIHP